MKHSMEKVFVHKNLNRIVLKLNEKEMAQYYETLNMKYK